MTGGTTVTVPTGTTTSTAPSTATSSPTFPEQFADLEPFAHWVLETWRERYELRLASSMEEMQAFYDTVMPRVDAILDHCDQFDIDDLPEEVRHLMQLLFALGEAAFPVEAWRQPRVPDSGAADIELVSEPPL